MDMWTRNVFEVPTGSGSGFVWDELGHVVTNFHVVQDSSSQKVTLGDVEYEAKTVGVARDQDLAVLQIDAPRDKLAPLRVGTSTGLQVGQSVPRAADRTDHRRRSTGGAAHGRANRLRRTAPWASARRRPCQPPWTSRDC